MIFCIVGAILCSAAQYVPGPVGHAPQAQPSAWNYAVYSAPVINQHSVFLPPSFPVTRRG